jgi:LysR family hca operon transcriptional activator
MGKRGLSRTMDLLPAYVQPFFPCSVISRPLSGDVLTIDLVVGYNKANASPILKLFPSRIDDLIARVSSNRPAVKP